MRYSQKTAAAAHVSQIQAFMHAEERASISVSLGDQSASVFISFLCAVPEKLTPTDDAHLDHMCTLRLESFFTSEASLLVKSPPPRISTENTTIAVVGDDTYRTIWKCVCVRSRLCRGYMSQCTCAPAEMQLPLSPQYTHIHANKHKMHTGHLYLFCMSRNLNTCLQLCRLPPQHSGCHAQSQSSLFIQLCVHFEVKKKKYTNALFHYMTNHNQFTNV